MNKLKRAALVSLSVITAQSAAAETCEQKIVALTFKCMGQNTSGTVAAAATCRQKSKAEAACENVEKSPKPRVTENSLSGIDPKFLTSASASASTISKVGIVIEVGVTGASCFAVHQRSVGLIASARAFEQFDKKYLGPLGNLITAIKIDTLKRTGQDLEAAQEAANAALDTVVCKTSSHICASWMVGKTLGGLLSDGPKLLGISERSINDWWTDEIYNFMNAAPTDDDFSKFEAHARRKIKALKASSKSHADCEK